MTPTANQWAKEIRAREAAIALLEAAKLAFMHGEFPHFVAMALQDAIQQAEGSPNARP